MKAFPWIIAVAAIGAAAYVILNNQSELTTNSGLGNTAGDVSLWGSKERVKGTGGQIGGNLKQGLGKLTGDKQMQGEGVLDEVVGSVRDAAGKAAHAVSDTLRQS